MQHRIASAVALVALVACGKNGTPSGAPAAPPATASDAAAARPTPPPAPPDAPAPPAAGIPSFEESLRRGGLTFAMPAGFTRIPPVDNPQWQYAFAMRSDQPAFEVWMRIDPLDEQLAEAKKCKADPSCHGTDPNQAKATWLMAIAANIGGGKSLPQVNPLDPAKVKADFNADWGGVAMVEPDAVFKTRFPHVLVILLHKDDKADAVIAIAAGDDVAPADLERALGGLKFAP